MTESEFTPEFEARWTQAINEYVGGLLNSLDPTLTPAERSAAFSDRLRSDADNGDGRAQAFIARIVRRVSSGYKADRAFGSTSEVRAALEAGDLQRWAETQLRLRMMRPEPPAK